MTTPVEHGEPKSTRAVAAAIGVSVKQLARAADRGRFAPLPPVVGGVRVWSPRHLRAAAAWFATPHRPGRPRRRRRLEEASAA